MKQPDDFLKKIASQYVEQYGEQLERELEMLDQSSSENATPEFDVRIAREQKARKRRKTWRIWGAATAACLALLLIIPRAIRVTDKSNDAPTFAAEEAANDPQLPIAFTMSKNFTVSSVEQDRDQTVYYLANTRLDDVVMIMEREASATEYVYDDLLELEINGKTVLGRHRADYSILTFDHEGIRYTLTCRHDFRTLTELGESILS